MLNALSIEALAHYTRGMATLFFIMWAARIFKYRNRDKLVRVLFIAICFMAFGYLKDVVFLFTPLMDDKFVMNVACLIDNICTSFIFAFFFEAVRPGVVTVKRLLLAVALFVVYIPVYIILRNDVVLTVAFIFSAVGSFVSFVLIMIYISRYDRLIENNYSYTQNINVRWVGGCVIAYLSWFVVYYLCFHVTTWASEVFFDLFSIGIWYVLVFFTKHHRIVDELQELNESEGNIPHYEMEQPSVDVKKESTTNEGSGKEETEDRGHDQTDRDILMSDRLYQKMDLEKVFLDPNLSLVSLAKEIGTNKTYLSDYINRSGKTFYEYINDYRISESCRLIDETALQGIRMPLGEVAKRSGFNSISSFNRHFYKIKLMTPSAYQRLQLLSKP